MKKRDIFDVLVVYTDGIATSASSDKQIPFSKGSGRIHYNNAYEYFLETCAKHDLRAAFTTTADITGAGECRSYWIFKEKKWEKVNRPAYAELIFDKFSPLSKKQVRNRTLLFSNKNVQPFNNKQLLELFFDKLKTYNEFEKFTIPTVLIKNSESKTIQDALHSLNKLRAEHRFGNDFSSSIVVKDQFGAGGNDIYKVEDNFVEQTRKILKDHKNISFVIQPFMKFDQGFKYKNIDMLTDIRIIYQGGRITQTYIRIPKEDDFRCNEHQGGQLIYITKKEIPQKVLDFSQTISEILNKKTSLFALDFIVSNNNNVYLLEGNIGPGLDWNLKLKTNEIKSHQLINGIVKELKRRSILSIKETTAPIIITPTHIPEFNNILTV